MKNFSTQPVYEDWKHWTLLQNMTARELKDFLDTPEGKVFGLSKSEAKKLDIQSGKDSAKWILKMHAFGGHQRYEKALANWPPQAWSEMRRQLAFIKRTRGQKHAYFDKNGKMTRHLTSLLGWGHDPFKYEHDNLLR